MNFGKIAWISVLTAWVLATLYWRAARHICRQCGISGFRPAPDVLRQENFHYGKLIIA
ncbi:MAG: hypothetical protein ACLSE8_10915 [Parasutterella sp.]